MASKRAPVPALKPAETRDPGKPERVDGRRARSLRTRSLILEAYLVLLREKKDIPTSEQVAQRAGLSTRAVFAHFADREALAVAAFDLVLSSARSTPFNDKVVADRPSRIRFQVAIRAASCEAWQPLWQVVMIGQFKSPDIAKRIELVRARMRGRVETIYQPELASLAEPQRTATLSALETLTSFESWERMRGHYGLSYEAACDSWIYAIDRLLPPTPANSR